MVTYTLSPARPTQSRGLEEGPVRGDSLSARAEVHEALHSAVLAQPELGVAVCAADGRLLETNPRLEELVGRRYAPLAPASWPSRYRIFDQSGTRALEVDEMPLLRALRGELVVDQLISTRPSHGVIRFLRCNGSRLYTRTGELVGAVVFVADVTAEVRQRRELDNLREQLVRTINHEIVGPLTSLKGHVELVQEGPQYFSPTTQWSLDGIGRSLKKLEGVLTTIQGLADGGSSALES